MTISWMKSDEGGCVMSGTEYGDSMVSLGNNCFLVAVGLSKGLIAASSIVSLVNTRECQQTARVHDL